MKYQRTNIEIDKDKLAKVAAYLKSKGIKDTVDAALEEVLRIKGQREIIAHFGMGGWEGDIDELRGRKH